MMNDLLVRLYRAAQPVLGRPLRVFDGDAEGQLSTLDLGHGPRDGAAAVLDAPEVLVERLTTLLDEHGVPPDFALLSVDTEGHDLAVLRGLDFARYRPGVIITETDEATEADKRALLHAHGYRLAEAVGVNTLWVHDG